ILEFSLLGRAVRYELGKEQSFEVTTNFDPECSSLSFISSPTIDGVPRRGRSMDPVLKAVRAGGLKAIEWDHRAAGGRIRINRPRVYIPIGSDGLETFEALAMIGRRDPAALERALAPLLRTIASEAGAVG